MYQNISSMALSRSYVRCGLCQGNVSIVSGNLDKMKSHLQNQHDVFHQRDFLIATMFLQDFEKEEIVSRVLPRMKVIFEGAKDSNKRSSEGSEEILSVPESKRAKTEDSVKEAERIDNRCEERKVVGGYEDSDDDFEIVMDENPSVQPTKTKDKEGNERGLNDEINLYKMKKFVKDQTVIPRRGPVVDSVTSLTPSTSRAACEFCGKEMNRKNIRRHVKVKHSKEERLRPVVPGTGLLLYKCKICSAQLASRSELRLHTSNVHTLDIEDVESMEAVTDPPMVLHDEINIEGIKIRKDIKGENDSNVSV